MTKKLLPLVLIAVTILLLASCNKESDGKWDDNIRLSSKTANFEAGIDSVSISTEGTGWWVVDISVGDSTYYGFEDIDIESDNYTIQKGGIVVERRNLTTLFIQADANTTGTSRIISVGLEAGDYFDRVTITQAAN
ncbi:MAG: hypothetical protein R2757_08815 [Draconibacterium sp.]